MRIVEQILYKAWKKEIFYRLMEETVFCNFKMMFLYYLAVFGDDIYKLYIILSDLQ